MEDMANASDLTSRKEAKAQHPEVDESAPAASESFPDAPESDVVFAQTPEEVEAQIVNAAAGSVDDEAGDAELAAAAGTEEAEEDEEDGA